MNDIKICKDFKIIDLERDEILFTTNNSIINNNKEIPSTWDVKEMIYSLLNINNKHKNKNKNSSCNNNNNNFIINIQNIKNSDNNNLLNNKDSVIYTFNIEYKSSSITPSTSSYINELLNNKIVSFYGIKSSFKFIVNNNKNSKNTYSNKNYDINNVSDSLIIKNLPKLIFLNYYNNNNNNDNNKDDNDEENKLVKSFKSIWGYFGQIKNLEILKNDIITFDIVLQFNNIQDSIECYKNMNNNKKLVYLGSGKEEIINNLEIEFDFNNYLSYENIRKRKFSKELLKIKEKERKEKEKQDKLKKLELERIEQEKRDAEIKRIEFEKQEKERQLQLELEQLELEIEKEKQRIQLEKEEKKKLKLEKKRKRELQQQQEEEEYERQRQLERESLLKQQQQQQQQQYQYQLELQQKSLKDEQEEYERIKRYKHYQQNQHYEQNYRHHQSHITKDYNETQLLSKENIQKQINKLNEWIDSLTDIIVLKSNQINNSGNYSRYRRDSIDQDDSYKMLWQLPSKQYDNRYYKSIENKINKERNTAVYVKGKSVIPEYSNIGKLNESIRNDNIEEGRSTKTIESESINTSNSTEINLESKELELKEMILKKRLSLIKNNNNNNNNNKQ